MRVCDLITPSVRTWNIEAMNGVFQARDVQLITSIPLAYMS